MSDHEQNPIEAMEAGSKAGQRFPTWLNDSGVPFAELDFEGPALVQNNFLDPLVPQAYFIALSGELNNTIPGNSLDNEQKRDSVTTRPLRAVTRWLKAVRLSTRQDVETSVLLSVNESSANVGRSTLLSPPPDWNIEQLDFDNQLLDIAKFAQLPTGTLTGDLENQSDYEAENKVSGVTGQIKLIVHKDEARPTRTTRTSPRRKLRLNIAVLIMLALTLGLTSLLIAPLQVANASGLQTSLSNSVYNSQSITLTDLAVQATGTKVHHKTTDGDDDDEDSNSAVTAKTTKSSTSSNSAVTVSAKSSTSSNASSSSNNPGEITVSSPMNFAFGQCTYWANLRYHEVTGYWVAWNGNADQWAAGARSAGWHVSTTPHLHSIVVLLDDVQGASSLGHVAFVEKVISSTEVQASNMNWYANGGGFDTESTWNFTKGSGVYFVWH